MSEVPRDLHVSKDPPRARDHEEHNTINEHATQLPMMFCPTEAGGGQLPLNMRNNLFVELPTTRLD